jgi:serine/threonine-protein kinase
MVYVVSRGGVARLVRRSLDETESHAVDGTEGALEPALSPDGHWLAFATSDGRIKKLSLDGGTPVFLGTGNAPAGMAWTRNSGLLLGMLRFSATSGLSLLAESGDTSIHRLTRPDSNVMHHLPVPLADGSTVLYQDIDFNKGSALGVASLPDGKSERVDLQVRLPIGVLDGILLYIGTDQHLRAVAFDAKHHRVSGAPVSLGEGRVDRASLATDGTLAMTVESVALEVVLVDEKGMSRTLLPDHATRLIVRYSPDGRRVALAGDLRGVPGVWVLDPASGALVKLGLRAGPGLEWSQDSHRVLAIDDYDRVIWQAADASDTVATMGRAGVPKGRTLSLSPDQRTLAVGVGDAGGEFDIVTMQVGDTTKERFAGSKANEVLPKFSPDGRYLVYVSDESGRYEVYARPFPGPGPRVQLSDDGGTEPIWARDGRRVFYRAGRAMMVAHLQPGPGLAVARHERLFEGDFVSSNFFGIPALSYDVAPDGHHFLMTRAVGGAGPEVVVWTNWLPELKARMARERR